MVVHVGKFTGELLQHLLINLKVVLNIPFNLVIRKDLSGHH
jgi:hypothetical protein